jgi:hypothetical protein
VVVLMVVLKNPETSNGCVINVSTTCWRRSDRPTNLTKPQPKPGMEQSTVSLLLTDCYREVRSVVVGLIRVPPFTRKNRSN